MATHDEYITDGIVAAPTDSTISINQTIDDTGTVTTSYDDDYEYGVLSSLVVTPLT